MNKTIEYLKIFLESDSIKIEDLTEGQKLNMLHKIEYLHNLGLVKANWATGVPFPVFVSLLPPGAKIVSELRKQRS